MSILARAPFISPIECYAEHWLHISSIRPISLIDARIGPIPEYHAAYNYIIISPHNYKLEESGYTILGDPVEARRVVGAEEATEPYMTHFSS